MGYHHQHSDILQLSSCAGQSNDISFCVQKTCIVEKMGNIK